MKRALTGPAPARGTNEEDLRADAGLVHDGGGDGEDGGEEAVGYRVDLEQARLGGCDATASNFLLGCS